MTSQPLVKMPLASRPALIDARAAIARQPSPWLTAARVILVCLLLFAPMAFGAVQPWAQAALSLLAVLVLCCWAVACVSLRHMALGPSPLYVPALLFLFLAVCQLLGQRTLNPIATRDSIILGCTYLILFAMATTLFGNATPAQWILGGKIVTVYTFALSFFAIVQSFTYPDKIYWTVIPRWGGYIFGPYVNHNHYAGLMEMLIALTATFWINRQRHNLWNWFAGISTLIALASVMLSGSRAGVACVLLEMVLLLGVALVAQYRQHRPNSPVLALTFALLAGLLLAAWLVPPETTARLRSAVHSQNASFSDRMVMARDSLGIFRAYPLTGAGLGSFETVYPGFQSLVTDFQIDHAHNDFAEILAETGTIGALLVVIALGTFLRLNARHFRGLLVVAGSTAIWLRLGAALGCLGLLAHSFFDFNLHIPANTAWFVLVVSLASAPLELPAPSATLFPRVTTGPHSRSAE